MLLNLSSSYAVKIGIPFKCVSVYLIFNLIIQVGNASCRE